jgi:short-subunit dehydrogenase
MKESGQGMVERRRGVILSIGSQAAFSSGENRAVHVHG